MCVAVAAPVEPSPRYRVRMIAHASEVRARAFMVRM